MAVEIRNRLQAELSLSLAATTLFNYATLATLTEHLVAKLDAAGLAMTSAPPSPPSPPSPSTPSTTPPADDDASLDDEQLAALIAQKFDATR